MTKNKTIEDIRNEAEVRAIKRVWTRADVAAEYGCALRTVNRWMVLGLLAGCYDKINGAQVRFDPAKTRLALQPNAMKGVTP